jgi:hypothetical protein
VDYGTNQSYYITEDEREIPLNDVIVEEYESIINYDSLNLPLNKYILHNDYKVFIGVSFDKKASEIQHFYNEYPFNTIKKDNLEKAIKIAFKKGDKYCYSLVSDSDDMTYMLGLVGDSLTMVNRYNQNFLSKQIHLHNEKSN